MACAELAEHVAAGSGGIQDGGDVFVETVSEDQAFAYLRRISSVSNAKLRDVAAPVVDKANAKASDTTSDSRADDIVEPP